LVAVGVDRFRRQGYERFDACFTRAEAAALLAAIGAVSSLDEDNDLSQGPMRFVSNVYRRSAEVQRFLLDPRILSIVGALVGPSAWCRWDQAVCKGPGAGTFPWHQDNGYTRLGREHLQIWVALTDAPAQRGGLLVEPGGHRSARSHRWVGNHVEVIDPPAEALALDASAGDVIAFSSFLPHATGPNDTLDDRWAYVAEFLPLDAVDESVERPWFVLTSEGTAVGRFLDQPPTRVASS